jgi:hypothetical protein
MTGQPTPPRIVEAFAVNAPNVTAPNGTAGAKTNPFPVPSQTGVINGAASLNDGFPPLTMTDPTAGGIPPWGEDMNGILYLISAWVAFLAAGQIPAFDADLAEDMSGYALGAVLQQTGDTSALWINTVDGNASDPDSGTPGAAGWISSVPLYSVVALTGTNNVVLPGPSDYVIDVDTSAGAIDYTGFVAQRDGQRVTFTNVGTGSNLLTFSALSGSSLTGNQMRLAADVGLVHNQSITIQYSQGADKWVAA